MTTMIDPRHDARVGLGAGTAKTRSSVRSEDPKLRQVCGHGNNMALVISSSS
jgi:hypothetical protein